MTPLPIPTSRILAVALLLAVLALVGFAGIGPLLAYSKRLGTDLDETRGMITRFAAIAAARDTFEQQLEALDAEQIEATAYLPGASTGVAAASLQELVGQIADEQGADLISTQALPSETEGERERTRIRVVLDCNIATLAEVLVALESHVPLVFVANLDIEPRQGRRSAAGDEDSLLVRFDLYGYRQGSAG